MEPALGNFYVLSKIEVADALWRVISLRDYNTRVVLLGTVLLGIGAGLLGVYLLLRRRVLIGDAIAHATLPGVVLAFLWTASSGVDKSLAILLIGGAISGALGGLSVLALRHLVQIREDAALGIVLSVFFGAGACLLKIATFNSGGNAAGLESFIYGKAASMTSEHVWLIGGALVLVLLSITFLGKELKILCFDATLARSQGWPILALDSLLIGLVVAITIVGLKAVGLIMIIALLVVPAASARFWTHEMRTMLLISAGVGAISCAAGTVLSAVFAKLPSGATIVLCGCACFAVSFAFGRERGVIWYLLRMRQLRIEQEIQHFLRATYEVLESRNTLPSPNGDLKSSEAVGLSVLRSLRHWTIGRSRRLAWRLSKSGLVVTNGEDVQLTPRGYIQALALVRDHRLIENYMIEEAAAPVNVADRAADYLEHDLQPEHLDSLKRRVSLEQVDGVLPSPHELVIDKSKRKPAGDTTVEPE
jgi:manganese/zinc/iron transport system permease protein